MIFPPFPAAAVLLTHGAKRLVVALTPTLAWADGATSAAAEVPGVSAAAMLQTVFGLLLILGLLFLAAYLLRRFNGGGHGFGGGGPLKIIGGLMTGSRERIMVLEVGDTWLVIGIVPGQIRTLHTMPKGEIARSASIEQPFGQWLKQMMERKSEAK